MWYVASIGSSDRYNDAEMYATHCVFGSECNQKRFAFDIVLVDSESGETAEIVDKSWEWGSLRVKLEWYNPYGFIAMNDDDFLLVTVDALSVRFASLVKSVCVVSDIHDNRLSRLLCSLTPEVRILGEDRPVVEYPTVHWDFPPYLKRLAFSLFHIVCFLDKGWFDGKYYLRASNSSWYCIEFADYHKARALISKSVFSGCNPIAGFSVSRPSLVIAGRD